MAKTGLGAPLVHSASVGESIWLNDLPVQANPNYVIYFNDFFTATDLDLTNEWNDQLGASVTCAITTDGFLGTATIATPATDNVGAWLGLIQENFQSTIGKHWWFSARLRVANAADCDVFVGLSEAVAAAPTAAVADAIHRVGFEINEGSANLIVKTSNGTASTVAPLLRTTTITSDTFVKLDIHWNGRNAYEFFVNNNLVAVVNTTSNVPTATDVLAPSFMYVNGAATAQANAMIIDYVLVAAER